MIDGARIDTRHSVLPVESIVVPRSLAQRSAEYQDHAVRLGRAAADHCLDAAGMTASDIDMLITVSCTGFLIPSLDAMGFELRETGFHIVLSKDVPEVAISRRHQRALETRGARRIADPRFGRMVLVHAGILIGAAVEVMVLARPFHPWVAMPMAAVFVQMTALPLLHGAWLTAGLGALAHAWVLSRRIALEDSVLLADPSYRAAMGGKPRFVPGVR